MIRKPLCVFCVFCCLLTLRLYPQSAEQLRRLEDSFMVSLLNGHLAVPGLFSTGEDNTLAVFDHADRSMKRADGWTGAIVETLGPFPFEDSPLYLSYDGSVLVFSELKQSDSSGASPGSRQNLLFVDAKKRSIMWKTEVAHEIGTDRMDFKGLAFDRKGSRVAVCITTANAAVSPKPQKPDALILYSLPGGREVGRLQRKSIGMQAFLFHPSEKYLAVQTEEGCVIWDDTVRKTLEAGAPLAFSPDGSLLATLEKSSNARLLIWETRSWKMIQTIPGFAHARFAFSPNNSYCAVCNLDTKEILLRELRSSSEIIRYKENDWVINAAFSSDGRRLCIERIDGMKVLGVSGAVMTEARASSTLPPSPASKPKFFYGVELAFDGDATTAWTEGVDGDGVGEYITFMLDREITVDSVAIMPGYFDARWWKDNNRIGKLSVIVNDMPFEFTCRNEMKAQVLSFPRPITMRKAKIVVQEVFPEAKYHDTCIAEVQFSLNGKAVPVDFGTAAGESLLMVATKYGSADYIRSLIKRGSDVNASSSSGETPLMYAIRYANVDAVKVLIEAGASLSARRNDGFTPLIIAAGTSTSQIVDLLLSAGADPWDSYPAPGTSIAAGDAMTEAARVGNQEAVRLIDRARKKGDTANLGNELLAAVLDGNVDLVRSLLDKGSDPNYVYEVEGEIIYGMTLLLTAMESGADTKTQISIITLLLDHGADINAQYREDVASLGEYLGPTPLILAVKMDDVEVAKLLLDRGADLRYYEETYSRDNDRMSITVLDYLKKSTNEKMKALFNKYMK